ncbi:MAG: hypothetical protein IPQ07_24795 [Myxococcales bacterium]|nr:hypothetical protein [Myxococcales bacterium]
MIRTLIAAAIVLTSSTAFAKDEFDAFVATLAAGKDTTSYFSGCELLVTPAGTVRQPCSLSLADITGGDAAVKLTVKNNKKRMYPMSQMEWREAEVEARKGKQLVATFRVIEIGGLGGNPDGSTDGWVVATHWSKLISDKEVKARALAKTLPAVPAINDKIFTLPHPQESEQAKIDREQAIGSLRSTLGRGDGTDFTPWLAELVSGPFVVFGSAPGQRYTGRAGKKSISGWKLALAPSGTSAAGGSGWVLAAATTMVATPADKSPPITYVVFAAAISGLTPGGGSFHTEPALIQFAVPN